jgi:tetratricopeptide (TPR) repeat protein
LPAYIALPFWFIQQLFMAMMNLDNSGQGGVAFFAHLGGFVFGVGAGLLLRYAGFDHKIAELIDPDMLAKPRDFRVGMKLLDQGQFRAGLAKLQKAQAANPDDSDILDSLFRCYISQNQSDLAFQAGSKLLPMLLRQRQDELAWPVYEEMLKIKPNYTPGAAYLLRLGRICEHRHDWGQAAAIYEQISQSPMSAQNRESVTEAARRLSEIQAQHPSDSPEPWPPVADMAHPANLNVSLAEQKPTGSPLDDLALPQTELAWSETPEARSLSYEIESGYSENQAAPDQTQADQGVPRPNLSKAERVVPRPNLSKTATNPPIPPAIPAEIPPVVSPQAGPMVRIALPLRKRIEAQETLLQKNPDNLSARIALGLAYQESGQAEKAREHFEAALRLKPDNAYVLARLRLLTPGAQQNSPYLKEIFSKPKDDPRETRQTKIILISSGGTLLVLIAFLLLKIFFLNGAYPISSPTAISSDPAWSPSGDALAFIGHERNADEPHLFVSEKRAEPQQIPLPDDIRMITAPIIWSPGGNKLLLRAHNDESALLLIIGRDGASPQIIPHAIDAAWSPDGHRLIYAAESDHYENNRISLNFFDLATATSQKVEVGEIGEIRAGNFQRAGLFWSTRANRIYFTAAKSLQPASVAPADEEEVMRQARQMMRQAILGQTQPYVRQYDQQIFEYEVSTTEVVGLTEGANHSLHGLSPDGQILLYGEENDDGREDIYTLDLPSQTRHKIIPAAALGDTPSISFRFDLKTIIFDGLIGQSSGMIPPGMGGLVNLRRPTDIFRVGIDGQNLERIETRHIAKSAPVASPVDRRIAYIMREMDGSSRIWVLRGW